MISVCSEKVKLAGRRPGGWSFILETGCFDAEINRLFPLLTHLFSVFFNALAGCFDKNIITAGAMCRILLLFILCYINGI